MHLKVLFVAMWQHMAAKNAAMRAND